MQIKLGEVKKIPRSKIRPFADQPRTYFDPIALQELADCIGEVGQLTPIHVRKLDPPSNEGHEFELIDGQRRLLAAEALELEEMIVYIVGVVDADDQYTNSVVANLCGERFTVMEEARAAKKIWEMKGGQTLEKVARIFSSSIGWVRQRINLLKLPQEVQELLEPTTPEDKRLAVSVATLLLGIPDPNDQIRLSNQISKAGLSMRQAKYLIAQNSSSEGLRKHRDRPSKSLLTLEGFAQRTATELEIILDTKVSDLERIIRGGKLEQRMRVLELLENCSVQFKALHEVAERILTEKKP